VGAGPSAVLWQAGGNMTISKTGNRVAVSSNGRPAPVRVKLQRINANLARAHPPDGDGKVWWGRLKKALGTCSSAFVNASLIQLQGAARLPGGGISEIAVNSALALIEAAEPRDEIEGALALQMACTHIAAMAILSRFEGGFSTERRTALFGTAAARLMRTYVVQVEAFRRLRQGGSQFMRVEHVHVNEGGQAVIGNVRKDSSGAVSAPPQRKSIAPNSAA
jgi:hypothetical protein